jgi:ATP adenylyltransferase
MEYILSEREEGCFLCWQDGNEGEGGPARQTLLRSELAFVILNGYPYNPGHLLVAPNRHVAELEGLDGPELTEVSHLLQRSIGALKEASRPDGFNLGMNLGRVAGAGVPEHLHWHVVPRWSGDTNFMPIVGRTRVLPELLADTYARLKPHFI